MHYTEYEIINSELKKLQQIDIEQPLPSINGSLNMLTDYIDRFHRLNPSASPIQTNSLQANSLQTKPLQTGPLQTGPLQAQPQQNTPQSGQAQNKQEPTQ